MSKHLNILNILSFILFCSLVNITVFSGELNYSQFFPEDNVIDIKLEIDNVFLEEMYSNPSHDEYYLASVDYNGYQNMMAGIKILDNKGVLNSSLMNEENREINMDSERHSFKLKFDEYIKGQSLLGLTAVRFNSNFNDPSFLKEYLSYQLMEEMGVPVPEYSFVNFYINGELKGIYLAVQQIDEVFIEDNFEVKEGDLYKVTGVGSNLLWEGNNIWNYAGIEYKSKKNTDHQVLLRMLDELNNGMDYEKYLAVDEIMRYFAVCTVLSNMDSYLGIMKQNYYLYGENNVFSIIPGNLKMSFGSYNNGLEEEELIVLNIDEPIMGNLEDKPLFARLLEVPEYKEIYYQYIDRITRVYLEANDFEKRVTILENLIRPHIKNDPGKIYSLEEFEESIMDLKRFVKKRVDNITRQLSREIEGYGDESGYNFNGSDGITGVSTDNFTVPYAEKQEVMADDFYQDNTEIIDEPNSEKSNEEDEAEIVLYEKIGIIIIEYFNIISTLIMLFIMIILSMLFLKRKL